MKHSEFPMENSVFKFRISNDDVLNLQTHSTLCHCGSVHRVGIIIDNIYLYDLICRPL